MRAAGLPALADHTGVADLSRFTSAGAVMAPASEIGTRRVAAEITAGTASPTDMAGPTDTAGDMDGTEGTGTTGGGAARGQVGDSASGSSEVRFVTHRRLSWCRNHIRLWCPAMPVS